MKFPDAYTIGRHLKSGLAALATVVLSGAIMAAFALTHYYSYENQSRLRSAKAAEKFVATAETDFPRNRVSVLYALHEMHAAYEETGENDPVRLGQLTRLDDWLVRSHTAGEEQAFLTEVRLRGRVGTSEPWFSSASRVMVSILVAEFFGLFLLMAINALLSKMDPRLRPSRATGN